MNGNAAPNTPLAGARGINNLRNSPLNSRSHSPVGLKGSPIMLSDNRSDILEPSQPGLDSAEMYSYGYGPHAQNQGDHIVQKGCLHKITVCTGAIGLSPPTTIAEHVWFYNRRDLYKLAIAFIFWMCSLYVMCIGNAFGDRLNLNAYVEPSMKIIIPDPVMENFSPYFDRLHIAWDINDFVLSIVIAATVVRIILLGNKFCTIIRRILLAWGTCQFFRALTVEMTILPNPYPYCIPMIEDNILWHAFLIMTRQRVSCGDMFFSGHTVSYTVFMMVWLTYTNDLYRCFAPIACFIGMTLIILSRYHYTIDIVIGFLLSLFVWKYIHWSIEIPEFQRRSALARFIYRVDKIDSEPYDHNFQVEALTHLAKAHSQMPPSNPTVV